MKAYIVRPTKYNESRDDHRFIVMAETELDIFRILHEMGEQSPRLYEFYEVKKEGIAVKLHFKELNDDDPKTAYPNEYTDEDIQRSRNTWKEPTRFDESYMLSHFLTMENSYPWLGFSDKIEYEAYHKLED